MGRKKVSLFLPSLRGGGAEKVAVRLVHGFLKKGLLVDLVLAKAEGPYLKELPKGNNFRLIDLNSSRVLYSFPGLVRYLKEENPESFLSLMNHANIVAIWAKMLSGYKGRFVVSERIILSVASKRATDIKAKIIPYIVKRCYEIAHRIVCVSKGVQKDLEGLGISSSKLIVIYNPTITPDIFKRAKEPVNHPWFQHDVPVILGIGRLTEQKDFSTLLRAFSFVRKEKNARLVILGEGEEKKSLLRLSKELEISDCLDFPGFDVNPYRWMERASLFVLSSQWEGLPNVLIEALALGTPVVSTDCPSGPREILAAGRWGRLVPVGDADALAKAMLEALSEGRKPMSNELRDHIKKFTLDEVVDQYIEVLFK